tara:strand:+ start:9753 stop:10025 length:273 start_codon:yes stop_codon:yes gene_type:complete
MDFEIFKKEFIDICAAWRIPIPHIHESADFSNHTSATDIHVYVEPGEDVAFQAAHIFGHYLCDLHGDNEKYQDKIANRIARWATQKEEIA